MSLSANGKKQRSRSVGIIICAIVMIIAAVLPGLTVAADDAADIPRGFVDPADYFAITSDTSGSELQNMMYTVDEYYLVPTELHCYGAFIFDIAYDGNVSFEAEPVAVDGNTTFKIHGSASSAEGTQSIDLTLKNFGRRGSFYKFQADVSGTEIIDTDNDHRENNYDYWWSSDWIVDEGIPKGRITFSTLLTDEQGKEYVSKYMAMITFRIAGIKPTKRSAAYLKEYDIKSTGTAGSIGSIGSGGSGGGKGLPATVGGIVGLSLLTAIVGGVGGAVISTAGAVVGAAAGETAGVASSAASGFDFGPHIRVDEDGDLNVRDPATGEERLYKANGDGTYTNPLTGATYTPAELKSSLESREDNADLIRQDEAVRKEAVTEQAEDNKNVSFYDAEAKAEKAAAEKEAEHDLYKEKMYFKYNAESGDDNAVKKEILEKTNEEYEKQAEYEARAEYADAGYKTAKDTKKAADVAIDVMAEIDKTGMGKVVKDGYAVASSAAGNMGEVMAGDKTVAGAFAQTVVESGVELAKNHSEGVVEKLASNIFGDSAKEMSNTAVKGGSLEDIRQAGEKKAIEGGFNAVVDIGFDGAGELASSAVKEGEKVVAKALGEEITKESALDAAKTLANDITKEFIGGDED